MSDNPSIPPNTRSLSEVAQGTSVPDWVKSMTDFYLATGSFRQEDVQKVLGDPKKSIEVGSNISLSSMTQSR